jgi:hypothetical protein
LSNDRNHSDESYKTKAPEGEVTVHNDENHRTSVIMNIGEERKLAESEGSEETEDATLKREHKRKKARLRRRGPYRKAHADW